MDGPLHDIKLMLQALEENINCGDWRQAATQVRQMDVGLRKADAASELMSARSLESVRAELTRLQRLSEARRILVGDELRLLGRGRKALKQYA